MQCDFDTIGTESTVADTETVMVIHDLIRAIGIEDFQIRLNHRRVLAGLLEGQGLEDRTAAILRALDKLPKIGAAKVAQEMAATAGTTAEQAAQVLELATIEGSSDQVLAQLDTVVGGSDLGQQGVAALRSVIAGVLAGGVDPRHVAIDASIARGLDYYTGTVVETFLTQMPTIGSICSGGRYDDLASVYSRQRLPGIGASLGLDRLLAAMEELGLIQKVTTPAPVFIAYFDQDHLEDYLRMAARLRAAGLGVELYPEAKKLGQQLKYADRRGFRLAIIAGQREFDSGVCQLKDLRRGTAQDVKTDDDQLIQIIRQQLAG
jgi:histidyl-tRNA synthetase